MFESKLSDILTTHSAKMRDTVNFPEPEEQRAHFTSDQNVIHKTHYFYSKWVSFKRKVFRLFSEKV